MRDLKGFIVVAIIVAITYWGVEPLAHSVMHPHVAPANFDFAAEDHEQNLAKLSTLETALNTAKAGGDEKAIKAVQGEYDTANALAQTTQSFWNDINAIDLKKGDAVKGAELIAMAGCTGCHGLEKAGMPGAIDPATTPGGLSVAPTDISNIAYYYDEKFIAALIKDPVKALKLSHKYGDENPFEMPAFAGAGGDVNEEIAHMVAYLKSIAPAQMEDKEVFKEACARCHDMKYDKVATKGNTAEIAKYLGTTPPDLSMYIRSRDITYLHNFINDPQKMLEGTAMPRVGLNEKAQNQVVAYMSKVGDSKKEERESLGINIMIYFLILSVFAVLWKMRIWKDLH